MLAKEPAEASFELDSHLYAIADASFSTISSSGDSNHRKVEKVEAVLKGTRSLGTYEVIAVIFGREGHQP
jgi:hypothetical protein